jgi:peptidyl-tRNA hydrolase
MSTKQVILVRQDLNMPAGKAAAQVGHAAMLFIIERLRTNTPFTEAQIEWMFKEKLDDPNWNYGGMKKIVLAVKDLPELLKTLDFAQTLGLECHMVHDEGLDCITCGAIGPTFEDEMNVVTDHLRLY